MHAFGAIDFFSGDSFLSNLGDAALNIGVNLGEAELRNMLLPGATGTQTTIQPGTYAPLAAPVANTVASAPVAAADSGMTKYLPYALGGLGVLVLVLALRK
jgi:hypothetical protein